MDQVAASPVKSKVQADNGDVRVAVILPAYNEELTIRPTIEGFAKHLPQAEIVVINNNSADRTRTIAIEALRELGVRGRVLDEYRQGKANAVRRAFAEVDADVYLMADADTTYPPEQAAALVDIVARKDADMVVGDRQSNGRYAAENKRALHGFGNWLVTLLVNRLFRARLVDIMSGYRAMSRCFVKSYPVLVEGFELETDLTLNALDKRFRIVEVPVEYRDRPPESLSKLNTFGDGARVLFTIAQILRYYRPLLFFGTISLAFGLAGLLAAVPVINDWIRHSYIYHVPLAVLAAALELAAFLSLSVGLVLDSLSHQNRRDFELRIIALSNR